MGNGSLYKTSMGSRSMSLQNDFHQAQCPLSVLDVLVERT